MNDPLLENKAPVTLGHVSIHANILEHFRIDSIFFSFKISNAGKGLILHAFKFSNISAAMKIPRGIFNNIRCFLKLKDAWLFQRDYIFLLFMANDINSVIT